MPTPVTTSRTRRRALALAIGACFLLALSIPLILVRGNEPQIGLANAARLRGGMPKAEVVALLGPPRVEASRTLAPLDEHVFMGAWRGEPEMCRWIGDVCCIEVTFDDGSVYSWRVVAPPFQNETWLDRALWRLRKSFR